MKNSIDPLQAPWLCDAAELAALAPTPQAQAAIQQMLELGKDYAALAQQFLPFAQTPGAVTPVASGTDFATRYLALFAPNAESISRATEQVAGTGAAVVRYQNALQRHGQALAAIAQDAGARMTASLGAETGPPITSLRDLHLLWVACGERAFADAAHREDFAATQAELLAAWVEVQYERQRQGASGMSR